MKKLIFGLIILIILLLCILEYKKYREKNCPKLNIIQFENQPNPKIVIIGGTHGDEAGPTYGMEEFIKINKDKLKRGTIIFIPRVNVNGIKEDTRYLPCKSIGRNYDINRQYGIQVSDSIEQEIIDIIRNANFVLDFHEGYDFHRINANSIGSTISPNINSSKSKEIATFLVSKINQKITEEKKKFTVIAKKEQIKYSLRHYCEENNINYNLIEITGQNNRQPLHVRKEQAIIIIEALLKYYKLF
tara:strand:- start:54 stop:788 length:735 start_codon:yes stop_codon:yes gene_type:complete